MKNLFLAVFILTIINLPAQTSYNCYHLQEFAWNTKTLDYDIAVEKSNLSVFKIDQQKKNITQTFEDGVSHQFVVKSEIIDVVKNSVVYEVISPSNGYKYQYKIDSASHVIEIILAENEKTTLLKKYLYKD